MLPSGDEGDIFYIVEEGSLDVWIKAPGTIHPVKVIRTLCIRRQSPVVVCKHGRCVSYIDIC